MLEMRHYSFLLELYTQLRKTTVTGRWIFLHITQGVLALWNGATSG
jgi:hypothetical protein